MLNIDHIQTGLILNFSKTSRPHDSFLNKFMFSACLKKEEHSYMRKTEFKYKKSYADLTNKFKYVFNVHDNFLHSPVRKYSNNN